MLESVIRDLKQYDMIGDATEVTVALSGGADSVALLLCLLELKEKLQVNISAAHLNHCLRGKESDADELFVRKLCADLGVELTVERADINAQAKKDKESIELCARRVRYEFLERVSKGLIATAHTANDNIETVLLNLSRGTGISGLSGIPPKRNRIIRPLISVTRQEVEDYCAEKGYNFCIDSTNTDENYKRNFIRHSVVPKLSEVNSNVIGNVANMSATLRNDADLLRKIAKETFDGICKCNEVATEELCKLHPAILSRCIALLYEKSVGRIPEYKHIESIIMLLNEGGKCSVQNDFSAVVKDGFLKFVPSKSVGTILETEVYELPFCDFGIEISEITPENFKLQGKINNLLLHNAFDCDKICGKLVLRSRIPRDEIKLIKRNCTKSLKKLFNEAKIEETKRDLIPVLADDEGPVWVAGFGTAERCRVDDNTKNIWLARVLNSVSGGKL